MKINIISDETIGQHIKIGLYYIILYYIGNKEISVTASIFSCLSVCLFTFCMTKN